MFNLSRLISCYSKLEAKPGFQILVPARAARSPAPAFQCMVAMLKVGNFFKVLFHLTYALRFSSRAFFEGMLGSRHS
eukprot:1155773-Pelagomonas_calceolata.AAC.4